MTKEYYKMNTENGTPLIQVDDFLNMKGIKHGFTTRVGGVSTGIYKSLNMGFYLGDDRENVMENYRRVGKAMGIDIERMSCPNQVHKSNVLVVTEEDAGDGITRDLSHFEIDAQITNVKDLPLIVYTADCVPILLADPVSRVIGTVHAGWRGSVSGIAAKTVHKMVEVYGCLPENIHAVIGPSIGPENYEVDQTVIDELFKCPYIDMSPENISYTDIFTCSIKTFMFVVIQVHLSETICRSSILVLLRQIKVRYMASSELFGSEKDICLISGI